MINNVDCSINNFTQKNKIMLTTKKFSTRAFVSTGMLFSAFSLPLSGLMNHYYGFEGLTVARHFWMSLHNISGILLLFFSVYHIILNRKAVFNYIGGMKKTIISREAIISFVTVIFFTGIITLHALLAG